MFKNLKYMIGILLVALVAGAVTYDTVVIKNNGILKFKELRTNGSSEINMIGPASLAADRTLTLPDATDTLVGKATTDTLTNKTLSGNTATNLISGSGTLTLNTSGTITVPNATDTLVGKATTDTFTNKTINADGTGNSITNIENADIKAGAAIDGTKIANGTVTSAEYQFLGDVTGLLQAQLDLKAALAGPSFTTGVSLLNEAFVKFFESGSTNFTAFKAPSSLSGDVTFTLPDGDGSSGQVLGTNGSGTLSWLSPTSGTSSPDSMINMGAVCVISVSDVVCDLKQADGSSAPASGSGAVIVSFRDPTVTTGGFDTVSFVAANQLTIESQDSVGAATSATAYLYLVSDTTDELCISAALLDENLLHSATALTGGAETTYGVLYCTGSHTSRPIRRIGLVDATWSDPGWSAITVVASNGIRTRFPTVYLKDVKSAGTAGGTATAASGFETRTLNTVEGDSHIVTLSSNQFTLQAGTYDIWAQVPAHRVIQHVAKLRNTTDSTDDIIGGANLATVNEAINSYSVIMGRIVITAAKTFEIQHNVANDRATDGQGEQANLTVVEVYTQVMIRQVR